MNQRLAIAGTLIPSCDTALEICARHGFVAVDGANGLPDCQSDGIGDKGSGSIRETYIDSP